MRWGFIALLLALPGRAQQSAGMAPPSAPPAISAAPTASANAVPPVEFAIPSHNGGLNTFYSPDRVPYTYATYLQNAYLDSDAGVVKRNGYVLYGALPCSGPVTGGWSFTNLTGVAYHFLECSGQLYKTSGDGSYAAIGNPVSNVYPLRGIQGLGYLWFSNGLDPVFYTDGVVVSSLTTAQAPLGALIDSFQNRIVLANISGGGVFSAGPSSVWLSGYNNGSDYTLPAVPVDTNAVVFGLNGLFDSRNVTCMFGGYKNVLIIWNTGQMYGLYGSGQGSFSLNLLSNEVGCIEPDSIREYNGKLHWLSKRGVEEYNGTILTSPLVSLPIQDQIQNIITTQQNVVGLQHNVWTGDNLTVAGPQSALNAAIIPGSTVPSTWTVTDALGGATFSAPVSTETGMIKITTAAFFVQNGDFETHVLSPWTCSGYLTTYLTHGGGALYCGVTSVDPLDGSWSAYNYTTVPNSGIPFDPAFGPTCGGNEAWYKHVNLLNANGGAILTTVAYDYPNGLGEPYYVSSGTIDLTAFSTQSLQIQFYAESRCLIPANVEAVSTLTSATFTAISSISWVATDITQGGASPKIGFNRIDNVKVNRYFDAYTSSQSYLITSQVFDTGFSTPIYGPFLATGSADQNSTFTFAVRGASSVGGPFTAYAAISTGSVPALNVEFVQYESTVSILASTAASPSISGATLSAETTGTMIITCLQPDAGITSWGGFNASYIPNGGSIAFFTTTGTACGQVQMITAPWTAQPNNTIITLATATAIGVKAIFSASAFPSTATLFYQFPVLQSITVNYLSGLGRPALVTTTYDRRYYLAYSTNIALGSHNNQILVYDMNGAWSHLNDINASAMFSYGLKWYTGSSLGDGDVFLQDTGLTDNGNFFTFDFKSPSFNFGSPFYLHDLDDLYVEGKGTLDPTKEGTLYVSYYVDGGTTPYSLGGVSTLQSERGAFYNRYAFPTSGYPTKIHTIQLEYSNSDQSPLRIYQSLLRYWPESLP